MYQREFKNIAKLVKTNRDKVELSQSQVSMQLGYKNAQFISNLERRLCSIPAKQIKPLAKIIKVDKSEVIKAMVDDFEYNITNIANGK